MELNKQQEEERKRKEEEDDKTCRVAKALKVAVAGGEITKTKWGDPIKALTPTALKAVRRVPTILLPQPKMKKNPTVTIPKMAASTKKLTVATPKISADNAPVTPAWKVHPTFSLFGFGGLSDSEANNESSTVAMTAVSKALTLLLLKGAALSSSTSSFTLPSMPRAKNLGTLVPVLLIQSLHP